MTVGMSMDPFVYSLSWAPPTDTGKLVLQMLERVSFTPPAEYYQRYPADFVQQQQ